jgi:hypothetical protein
MKRKNLRYPNITLLAHECWIIRLTRSNGDVWFVESYKQLNRSPAFATIFRDWDAAWQALWAFQKLEPPEPGEFADVVPLYGALLKATGRLSSPR